MTRIKQLKEWKIRRINEREYEVQEHILNGNSWLKNHKTQSFKTIEDAAIHVVGLENDSLTRMQNLD